MLPALHSSMGTPRPNADRRAGERRDDRLACWLYPLWYDPAIPSRAPGDLPVLRHFADIGIVSVRADRSGNESLVVFKCG